MLDFDKLKQYADMLSRGAILEFAPGVVEGMFLEIFQEWQIDTAKVTRYVKGNLPLWDRMEPRHREMMRKLAQWGGKLEWITADWVIQAIKKDYPGVASLLLGWPEAHTWLEEQVAELKKIIMP